MSFATLKKELFYWSEYDDAFAKVFIHYALEKKNKEQLQEKTALLDQFLWTDKVFKSHSIQLPKKSIFYWITQEMGDLKKLHIKLLDRLHTQQKKAFLDSLLEKDDQGNIKEFDALGVELPKDEKGNYFNHTEGGDIVRIPFYHYKENAVVFLLLRHDLLIEKP